MIEQLLPRFVATVETRAELLETDLFPDEAREVEQAVEKRRREFVTGRACAREALRQLGIEPIPIPTGERGEPRWPDGIVGSITHCSGYRASAAARSCDAASIGIDAEPNAALPEGVSGRIAFGSEYALLGLDAGDARVDRLLFSAKEAVYKAWFPLARRWLGFEDVEVSIDPTGCFRAELLVPGPVVGEERALTELRGRWMVENGIICSAVLIPTAARRRPSP